MDSSYYTILGMFPPSSSWSESKHFYAIQKAVSILTFHSIVFVHGLFGNSISTWRHSSGVLWGEGLLNQTIPESRILTYGYDANIVHFWAKTSQNPIGRIAYNLASALAQLRFRTDSVCNSFVPYCFDADLV
jgi:hypothetical protein